MSIGKRIRELRETKKMSLTDLSQKSGVQIATLSRIENLKMTGTLESHLNIARALEIDVTELYKELSGADALKEKVAYSSRGKPLDTFSYNDKASYEILTTNVTRKKMMPVVLRVEPGGKTNAEQDPPGSEKFLFVLEGSIEARIGDKTYPLSKNNTLYFDAAASHFFTNTGKTAARIICVETPVAL